MGPGPAERVGAWRAVEWLAAATVGLGLGVGLHVLNNSDLGDRIPSVGGRNILVLGAVVAIVFLFGQAWLAVEDDAGTVSSSTFATYGDVTALSSAP